VIVGDIPTLLNYLAVGNLEALSLATTSCNLGNGQLMWDPCPANTHPVIGQTLYKWYAVDGATRFEQIGQSWLKHASSAQPTGTTCCANCQSSGTFTRLGVGCSDAYSANFNGTQSAMGPKYQVNPHTGEYPAACPPHPSGGNTGRLEVDIADLTLTAGGPSATVRYFGQAQYVTADDATAHNQDNNASYREVTTSLNMSDWNFALLGAIQRESPAIRVWKDIDTGVVETDVPAPEDDGFPSLIILAAKSSDLGTGFWRYEYAVNNLNSDRAIGSFAVPVSIYAVIANIGFHDVTFRGGDGLGGVDQDGAEWPATVEASGITWATTPFANDPNANALRWGTLYNFRFDADIPPVTGNVMFGQFKVVNSVSTTSIVPTPVSCTKGDLDGNGLVNGADIKPFADLLTNGGGTAVERCAGDVGIPADGLIDLDDLGAFAQCLLGNCV
jgi:hypothetical protein